MPQTALVGRDSELEILSRLVKQVATGRGRSVWVEGEPGIGKSALLTAGLAHAHGLGCAVYWESADEARQRFPLWVLLDCLRVALRSSDPARAEIAGLLRGEGSAGLTPADVVSIVAERLLVLVDRLCAASPVVLVVEDLQWADGASLSLWGQLHRAVGQLPLLLVAACRPVPPSEELVALRDTITADAAVVLTLGPLDAEQAVDLAGRLAGGTPGPRLRRQVEQAGGNPLYVRELVDALLREQAVRVAAGRAELAGSQARRPVSLAAAIAKRLGFLSERTAGGLQLAALLGPEFSVADLRLVTGQASTELAEAIQEAVAGGVLAESGSGDRLAFRHGLIRQALYDGIPTPVRSALHRHAAQALAGTGVPADRVAEHLLAGPRTADAWMVGWVAEAAPALLYRAPQIAVELLERVREATDLADLRREQLDASLVTALFLLGRNDDAELLARPLLASTRDAAVAGRMAWILGYVLMRTVRPEEALVVTSEALEDPKLTGVWRARVWALQAMVLTQFDADRSAEAQSTAREAQAEGERAGDPLAVGYALHALSMVRSRHELDTAALLEVIDRALAVLGDQPEATDLRVLLLGNRMVALDNLGRLPDADRVIGEALALAERAGTPQRLAQIRLLATEHCFLAGRWDDSLAEIQAAGDLLLPGPPWSLLLHGLWALIAGHRDERAVLKEHLAAIADLEITGPGLRAFALYPVTAQALAAERDSEPGQALARLLAVLDPDPAGAPAARAEDSHLWLPDVVRLALAVGDRATAQAATEGCEAEAGQTPTLPKHAAAEHCRALLDADASLLLVAVDAYERAGLPLFRAQALENAAVLLAQQGDTARAHAAHSAAVDIYAHLGAAWDILRAGTRLRPFGVRRGSRGSRGRPGKGWDALTPTEVKVAELVAEGRSNPDVAADLFLSRRTVQSHVSHILAKLGGNSRVDIVREAMHHSSANGLNGRGSARSRNGAG